jgi:hypothetical protein
VLQGIRSRQSRHVYVQALVLRWLIVLAAGVAIGIVAFFFNWVQGVSSMRSAGLLPCVACCSAAHFWKR